MRVFVYEFLTAGGDVGLPESFIQEGRAMRNAILQDLLRIPHCRPMTLQAGWHNQRACPDGVSCQIIDSPAQEWVAFCETIREAHHVLIAPEIGGELERRVAEVVKAGVDSWNCSPSAIAQCRDKREFSLTLCQAGMVTPPTRTLSGPQGDFAEWEYNWRECSEKC